MDSNKTSQSKSNNQSKMTVEDAFKQATDHFIANRYSEADKLCTTILQIAPNLIDALNLSGLIAQKINSHDLAVEQFKKAINFDNNRALLHYNLGISLYALNQKEDSIEVLKIALKKEPGNSLIINCLNSITDKTGSTSSIGNQSQNEMEFLQRAVEFHQSGQIDDAIHWYLKTLAINPESSIALSNMGVALQTLGKLEEAILSYQKAISYKSKESLKKQFLATKKQLPLILILLKPTPIMVLYCKSEENLKKQLLISKKQYLLILIMQKLTPILAIP